MKTFIILFAITLAVIFSTGSCKESSNSGPTYFSEENLIRLTSDSAMIEAVVKDAYDTILIPLYYDACTTDDWTDNLYFSGQNSVVCEDFEGAYTVDYNQIQRIKVCDHVLSQIARTKGTKNSDKLSWSAEIRLLRAMISYYQIVRFGSILFDSVMTSDGKWSIVKGMPLRESYDLLIQEIEDCIPALPTRLGADRISQAAALALITRIGLQAAAYLPEEKDKYLQMVIRSAEKIMTDHRYALDSDYGGLFNDFYKGHTSPEVIWGVFRKRAVTRFENTQMQHIVPNQSNEKMRAGYGPQFEESFAGWSKRYPSQDLVDDYLVIDSDGLAKKWTGSTMYNRFNAGQNFASAVLYSRRDKRFYSSIVYDSCKYFDSWAFTRERGNLNTQARADGNLLTPTGYYIRKSLYENLKLWYMDGTDHHMPVVRLGEVYLNFAEALLLAGRAGQAIAMVNATRRIHGGLPPLDSDLNERQIWDAYKRERRVELFFENDRYWSLLRWARFSKMSSIPELNRQISGIIISADGKSFRIEPAAHHSRVRRKFSADRFFLPLPIVKADSQKLK